jgi:hypothetical protein
VYCLLWISIDITFILKFAAPRRLPALSVTARGAVIPPPTPLVRIPDPPPPLNPNPVPIIVAAHAANIPVGALQAPAPEAVRGGRATRSLSKPDSVVLELV